MNKLRLILGDQLNINHSWFKENNSKTTYVLMEVKEETSYVLHHSQKIIATFAAMRFFAVQLQQKGFEVIYFKINDKENDSIYDRKLILHSGNKYITEKIEKLKFKIYPKSFFQTNINQTIILYEIVKKFADLNGNEIVYDLYSGLGTISQFLAKKAKKVIGIESIEEAVISAKESEILNNINNVKFQTGDMKTIFTSKFIKKHGNPDIIITDPPRDGMHKDVIKEILKLKTKTIVYVSCNPATQLRDLEKLKEKYAILKVQPVDMFPHTDHVENVVLLKHKLIK